MSLALHDPAALFADDQFVRGVAWNLLHDEDRAADAAQETWLSAIESPPAPRSGMRGWLTVVTRNAARLAHRRETRRGARERRASRPEGVPSVADVVEREETRRHVVDAVLALDATSRDVVLLRFFESLPPREVARRLGIPVNTVRSRTRRAIETLRARLDDRYGGDRRAWAVALLPLAGRQRISVPAWIGGIAMAVTWKIVAVTAAAAVIGVVAWKIASPGESSSESSNESAKAPPMLTPAAPPPLASAPGGKPVASPPSSPRAAMAPGESAPAAAGSGLVRGRVVDEDGKPMGGVMVWIDVAFPGVSTDRAISAADGTYKVAAADGHRVVKARTEHHGTAHVDVERSPGAADVVAPDLVMTQGAVIRGRVLDANGKPAPMVRVKTYATADGADVIDTVSGGRRLLVGMDDVVTAADGTFVLAGLEPGIPHRVWLETYMTPDFRGEPEERTGVMSAPPPGGEPIEFRYVPKNAISGVVVDARTKRPVPRFTVNQHEISDPDGRFTVPAGVGGAITVKARGYLPEEVENPASKEGDRPPALTVRLSPDPDAGTLVITAKDDQGNPISTVRVFSSEPGYTIWQETLSSPTGEFRATGLAAGKYKGSVQADGYAIADLDADVPKAGETRVEVRLLRSSKVNVKIVDAAGNPARYVELAIADARGMGPAWRFHYARTHGTAFVITDWTVWAATPPHGANLTEGEGRIEGLPIGKYTAHVKGEGVEKDVPFEVAADKEASLEVRLGP